MHASLADFHTQIPADQSLLYLLAYTQSSILLLLISLRKLLLNYSFGAFSSEFIDKTQFPSVWGHSSCMLCPQNWWPMSIVGSFGVEKAQMCLQYSISNHTDRQKKFINKHSSFSRTKIHSIYKCPYCLVAPETCYTHCQPLIWVNKIITLTGSSRTLVMFIILL